MTELSRHIEILLLDNDCVIVPGLGGFVAHYVYSQFIENEQVLCPPYRSLGFNPQLQVNDSLLVQSYIEAYDISYPEAERKIASEVEEIKQSLGIEGRYEFSGIGILEQTSDGHYDFHPATSGIVSPSLYGLNSFEISKVEYEEEPLDSDIEDEEISHVVNISTFRSIAMAAAILLLFILSTIPAGMGSGDIQQSSVVNKELIKEVVSQQVQHLQIGHVADTTGQTAVKSLQSEEPQQDATTVAGKDKEKHFYVLVVAAKVSKKGAKGLVDRLKRCGFVDTNICESSSNRKVIYGHYNTADEALTALRTLRTQDITFTDAWISSI